MNDTENIIIKELPRIKQNNKRLFWRYCEMIEKRLSRWFRRIFLVTDFNFRLLTEQLAGKITLITTIDAGFMEKSGKKTDHRRNKGLNNRVENAHQPTRRREKSLIKMKRVSTAWQMLKL